MSEQQPEYVWAFPPERPRRAGRVWLIVALSVVAVAVAAGLFLLMFRPWASGDPVPSGPPGASATPGASPSAPSSPSGPATPTAVPTPPPPADPSLATFRDKVAPVLDDAETGLAIAAESGPAEAVQTIDFLLEDAGRLNDSVAPSSISERWTSALDGYASALRSLRAAYESGTDGTQESDAAGAALARLNEVVGR